MFTRLSGISTAAAACFCASTERRYLLNPVTSAIHATALINDDACRRGIARWPIVNRESDLAGRGVAIGGIVDEFERLQSGFVIGHRGICRERDDYCRFGRRGRVSDREHGVDARG